MIFVLGNSHCNFFNELAPSNTEIFKGELFTTIPMPGIIAYNFYEHHMDKCISILNKLEISIHDRVLLVLGEVDCRYFLPKEAQSQNKSLTVITRECLDRFIRVHICFKRLGFNPIGWGGHPSTTHGEQLENLDWPIFGDCLTRNSISLEWDNYLSKLCSQNSIPYVSIIDHLINSDTGLTKMEYFLDFCHLDPEKLLKLVVQKFAEKSLLD